MAWHQASRLPHLLYLFWFCISSSSIDLFSTFLKRGAIVLFRGQPSVIRASSRLDKREHSLHTKSNSFFKFSNFCSNGFLLDILSAIRATMTCSRI